jgi:hypothetical protein
MKKSILLLILFFLTIFGTSHSQNSVDRNTINSENNLSKIESEAKFFFYPNLDAYFNTQTNLFFYKMNNQWICNSKIPDAYRGYSIYNNYRVAINDYHGEKPFEKLAEHKKQFPYYSNNRKGKIAAIKAKALASSEY